MATSGTVSVVVSAEFSEEKNSEDPEAASGSDEALMFWSTCRTSPPDSRDAAKSERLTLSDTSETRASTPLLRELTVPNRKADSTAAEAASTKTLTKTLLPRIIAFPSTRPMDRTHTSLSDRGAIKPTLVSSHS